MKTILVTGAGSLLGQGILKSLKLSPDYPIRIVTVDPDVDAVGHQWGDQSYRIPMAEAPTFVEVLLDIVKKESVDVIIPGTDIELPILSSSRSFIESEGACQVLVSRPDLIETADDKYKTTVELARLGISVPLTFLESDDGSKFETLAFPVIVKPRSGARSRGVTKLNTIDQLHEILLGPRPFGELIVQECISDESQEYTAGAVCFPGSKIQTIVMNRTLRDGNTVKATINDYPELNCFIASVANKLQPNGPINFQFRTDSDGPKIFEINARFSGTTIFRSMAGFNEVNFCVGMLTGENVRPLTYTYPLVIQRYWEEQILSVDSEGFV